MALWRTGEEAMAGLANHQADVMRFEMAGSFTVAAALQKVAHTGYLFAYLKARQCREAGAGAGASVATSTL